MLLLSHLLLHKHSYPIPDRICATGSEYLLINLYDDPGTIFKAICQLIDEHKIAGIHDTMTYFYEVLSFKGYAEYAQEFAKKYNIQIIKNEWRN
jgi:hypothetical protein